MKFLYPVPSNSYITQTYQQHVDRAKANGWCYSPGQSPCPNGYYYGGIDWGVPTGTSILAAHSGTVITKRESGGYGNSVRITSEDNVYMTIYGHMKSFSVADGTKVKAGDVIGLSDNTGNSTGPHLHFEARKNGSPFDPAPYLVKTKEELDEGTVTPPPTTTLPVFPVLPKAQIIVDVLNIRESPTVSSKVVGTLLKNDVVSAFGSGTYGKNIWIQIGYKQYIAMIYSDVTMLIWV